MKILVESGATKSDWRVIGTDRRFLRPGMNVSTMKLPEIGKILQQALVEEDLRELDGFYMYTAGIVTDEIRSALASVIREVADVAEIDIQDDLVGAARAACGHGSGIVAILGTGSNTCFYDGKSVERKVYSGGFILGDEGSGATLGKLFLADYIKGQIPAAVAKDFEAKFDSSYPSIVEGVYRSASPSGYLGKLAPFILSHYDDAHIKALVDGNFQAFIDRALLRYDVANYPVGVVGGFGNACRDIFTRLCAASGIRISRFIPEPIVGLLDYHD